MTVFLTTSTVVVWRAAPQEFDTHGWAVVSNRTQVGSYPGNVQERLPLRDPLAADGGGQGPYQPDVSRAADIYLPGDADVVEGDLLESDGLWWLAGATRPMPGPLAPLGATVAVDAVLWTPPGD